ncbi:MAG: hypothetical protein M3457_17080, partial [Chloroflexota bacterium]|nr:hypothetical protein [Chloroflexota bacterium]
DLYLMRLVLVVAGTLTIYLGYRLGRAVTGDARVGLIMAVFVALDPVSVQWSGHVRMYGLLQALTLGLAWAFIGLLNQGPSWGRTMLVVVLFWAAVFTHVGACLLAPAMLLAAWVVYRDGLFRRRRLLIGLALCGLGPLALLAANHLLGTASVGAGATSSEPILSFVGDNLLQPLARFQVSLEDWEWTMLVRQSTLAWLIAGLAVASGTIIGGRTLLRDRRTSAWTRQAVIVLLAFYWLPVIMVGIFTVSPKERYLLHVHLIGYLFVSALIVRLASHPDHLPARRLRWRRIASSSIIAVAIVAIGSGLPWRLENPVVHPNYNAAMAYVAERHEPGQPVIVALPAVGYLALDEAGRSDLRFLAGDEDRPRAQRYTRWGADGRLIDYWVGVDSIVTASELRRVLAEHPEAWIVVDDERLAADWAYAGEIGNVLIEMTRPVLEAPGGALVLRVTPLGR